MVKASIIIPTHKRVKHTRVCLSSILSSQGLGKDFSVKVILVDDSPDGSIAKLVKEFRSKLDLELIHFQKTVYVGEKRKIGVAATKDEIIIFSDSDIELTPTALKTMLNCFQKTPSAAMVTTKVIYKKGTKIGKIDRPRAEDRLLKINGVNYEETNYGRFLGTYRKIFNYLGGYDSVFENRGEGVDQSCRFWRGGFPIVYEPNCVVYHHHDAPDSLTRLNAGTSRMFASLILMTYKYDITSENGPYFAKIMNEGRDFQDKKMFEPVLGAAEMLDWFARRYKDIQRSKKALPKEYNFTPQDVFTDKKMALDCIKKAPGRIKSILNRNL